jgi:hypothetical protein
MIKVCIYLSIYLSIDLQFIDLSICVHVYLIQYMCIYCQTTSTEHEHSHIHIGGDGWRCLDKR